MSSDGRSHQQILADYAVVRIATACAIIGGDGDPVSDDTVYRLIKAGRLESPGKGKVTTASLRAHLESTCHANDAPKERAVSTKPRSGATLRSVRLHPPTANDATNANTSQPKLPLSGRRPRGSAKPPR